MSEPKQKPSVAWIEEHAEELADQFEAFGENNALTSTHDQILGNQILLHDSLTRIEGIQLRERAEQAKFRRLVLRYLMVINVMVGLITGTVVIAPLLEKVL